MTDPKTAAMVEAMLQRNENFRGTRTPLSCSP